MPRRKKPTERKHLKKQPRKKPPGTGKGEASSSSSSSTVATQPEPQPQPQIEPQTTIQDHNAPTRDEGTASGEQPPPPPPPPPTSPPPPLPIGPPPPLPEEDMPTPRQHNYPPLDDGGLMPLEELEELEELPEPAFPPPQMQIPMHPAMPQVFPPPYPPMGLAPYGPFNPMMQNPLYMNPMQPAHPGMPHPGMPHPGMAHPGMAPPMGLFNQMAPGFMPPAMPQYQTPPMWTQFGARRYNTPPIWTTTAGVQTEATVQTENTTQTEYTTTDAEVQTAVSMPKSGHPRSVPGSDLGVRNSQCIIRELLSHGYIRPEHLIELANEVNAGLGLERARLIQVRRPTANRRDQSTQTDLTQKRQSIICLHKLNKDYPTFANAECFNCKGEPKYQICFQCVQHHVGLSSSDTKCHDTVRRRAAEMRGEVPHRIRPIAKWIMDGPNGLEKFYPGIDDAKEKKKTSSKGKEKEESPKGKEKEKSPKGKGKEKETPRGERAEEESSWGEDEAQLPEFVAAIRDIRLGPAWW